MADEINTEALNGLLKSLKSATDSFKRVTTYLIDMNEKMEMLNTTCNKLSNSVSGINSSLSGLDFMTTSTFIFTMIEGFSSLKGWLEGVKELFGIVSGSIATFAGTLSFSLGAVAAVAAGIGLTIGALLIFGDKIDMSSQKTKDNIKILENKRQELDNVTESLKKNTQATKDNIENIQDDYAGTLAYFDELKKMEANGGIAGNMEKAKFLVEQINKVLPNSVSITKDNTLAWKGNSDEVRKNIELLEKKAVVEANQADYIEAMKVRSSLQAKLASATKEYNDAQDRQAAKEKEIFAAVARGENTDQLMQQFSDLTKETAKYKGILDSAEKAMAANNESIYNYKTSLEALDGKVESSSKALLEHYGTVSEDGLHTYGSLANGLMELNQKEKDYAAGKIQLSQEEIDINKRTREMIVEEMIKKADGYGDSYSKMIATLEERGVYLTDLEKQQLEERYGIQLASNQAKEGLQMTSLDNMMTTLEDKGLIFNTREKGILEEQFTTWQDIAAGKEGVQALNFENLIAKLEEGGKTLTDDEKEYLRQQNELWEQSATGKESTLSKSYTAMKGNLNTLMGEMNEDEKIKLNESIDILSKSGSTGGYELCQKLASSLSNNKGAVNNETLAIIGEINTLAENTDPTIGVSVTGPSESTLTGLFRTTASRFKNIFIGMDLMVSGIVRDSISKKANGGFADTGELFIAREAGPELVGRINGKTAVANNDQIVSGISAGVYNAVTSAMSGVGNKGNLNINAIFTMDGEVVGKQVIKYHNGVVKRTGKTPLLV